MKRDPDLIRKILLVLEEKEDCVDFMSAQQMNITNSSVDAVNYNLILLIEGGYIIGNVTRMGQGNMIVVSERLTWEGHEFLDAARDDTRWEKAKSAISKVGGWSFEIAKPILLELAKDAVKFSLGLA